MQGLRSSKNFKSQSQCFMTIFRNYKNQSVLCDHIWYHVSCININQFKYFLGRLVHQEKIKEHKPVVQMDKKRLKVALVVLDAVKSRFPETQEFIENTLQEECEKEKITADEVIFYKFRRKKLAWLNIFVLNLYYSNYFLFIDVGKCGKIVRGQNVHQKKK